VSRSSVSLEGADVGERDIVDPNIVNPNVDRRTAALFAVNQGVDCSRGSVELVLGLNLVNSFPEGKSQPIAERVPEGEVLTGWSGAP